tara:strand:- start:2428 stop:2937 length:510 start_codon:yes stop_codon:yes gene_type:complete
MEEKLNNKLELKTKLINFYNLNKVKIFTFILITIITLITIIFLKINDEKKNILLAEKYIQAGIFLTSNKSDEAKQIYEEIIFSKNKFYSILSLNTILEKNLISDKNKILEYFNILEKIISNKNNKDLIMLKKALYLIKESNTQEGRNLLKNLIENNSNLKIIAQEFLEN